MLCLSPLLSVCRAVEHAFRIQCAQIRHIEVCALGSPARKFLSHHVLSRGKITQKNDADERNFALRKRPIEGKMHHIFATTNHNNASLDMLGEYFLNIGAIGRMWLFQHRVSKTSHFARF